VRLAHQFAVESDLIRADMVEATEFPSLVRRFSVRGVPRTVVNERVFIDGALPEEEYLHRVLEATGRSGPEEGR
jgi:predicted DsbA family dithiol-disulfide isomerase